MRVLVAGDVHGDWDALQAALERARARHGVECAIQVGDLGLDSGHVRRWLEAGRRFALPVHAVDGNHDDHAWIDRALRRGLDAQWRERLGLHYQPRSSIALLGGRGVGFLGGALHVDRPQSHGLFWNISNYIQRRHRESAAELFNREQPVLMVTHSCPAGIGIGLRGDPELERELWEHVIQPGFDPGPEGDRGESALTELWRGLAYRPRAWVFGHFHAAHDARVDGTDFACAGDLAGSGRSLVWDSETCELLRLPS